MRRDKVFQIRVNEEEKSAIDRAAERSGSKASEWGRNVLLQATEPLQKEDPPPPQPEPEKPANGAVESVEEMFG